jgi:hypothetical protein
LISDFGLLLLLQRISSKSLYRRFPLYIAIILRQDCGDFCVFEMGGMAGLVASFETGAMRPPQDDDFMS